MCTCLERCCGKSHRIRSNSSRATNTTSSKGASKCAIAHLSLLNFSQRIGRYIITSQCLGSGSFATVHLAISTARQCQVACKSIRTKKEHELGQVAKEIQILMSLNHVSHPFHVWLCLIDYLASYSPISTAYTIAQKTETLCQYVLERAWESAFSWPYSAVIFFCSCVQEATCSPISTTIRAEISATLISQRQNISCTNFLKGLHISTTNQYLTEVRILF